MTLSNKNPTTVLIDGDIVVFKAAFSNEKTVSGDRIIVNPPHYAYKTAKDILTNILKTTGCNTYRLFLTARDHSNFRYAVAKTQPYKENRKDVRRPALEQDVRNYLIEKWDAIVVSKIEADDALGIEQCKTLQYDDNKNIIGSDTIICTTDKDLDMIPGWHYDLDVGRVRVMGEREVVLKGYKKKAIYLVKEPGFLALREVKKRKVLTGAGSFWFCAQMLTGDSTDNIPGLPGYGPVKTHQMLHKCKTYHEAMRKVYLCYKKELTHLTSEEVCDRLKEIAQLLWIKRNVKEKIFKLDEIIK